MSQPLPQLPKPEFVLTRVEVPPEVPSRIAVNLRDTGIPVGLIGYKYRLLSEPVYLRGIGERGLVVIATSGLFGRIGVDVASGRVVEVPTIESATASHVNRDLDSFNRCVEAVIARFPFYAVDDKERCDGVAEELAISSPVSTRPLWWRMGSGRRSVMTWRWGTTRTGTSDAGPVSVFGQPSRLRPAAAMHPSTRSGR
ncbi:hypothetical protein [Streptomyces sp. NPDC088752]|uniref:hypothetical protein n=1 Tax=Streptomyces sp. NPDC088752 TaxID=3154963 RepID=UPI0034189F36